MAKPKVFVSSTCYDLGEIRDSLSTFIRTFGFDPVLSEHGDVFYHPDLHTHDACINEVGNCQLFILLIGGRFGGTYKKDTNKSITNAEYEAAVQKDIPVFTYIKRDVLDNHYTFQSNREKEFVNDIEYPAIDKQADASLIFSFINQVRRSPVNNAYESFETSKDIEMHLRKQWAGMFFYFLKDREVVKQLSSTNEAINDIKSVSNKLEGILKEVYKVVDKDHAEESIQNLEIEFLAQKYFDNMFPICYKKKPKISKSTFLEMVSVDPRQFNWIQYWVEIGVFREPVEHENYFMYDLLAMGDLEGNDLGFSSMNMYKNRSTNFDDENKDYYEHGLCLLGLEERKKLISRYVIVDE